MRIRTLIRLTFHQYIPSPYSSICSARAYGRCEAVKNEQTLVHRSHGFDDTARPEHVESHSLTFITAACWCQAQCLRASRFVVAGVKATLLTREQKRLKL